MAFVVFDNRAGMYIARSTRAGFSYTDDINSAEVFRTRKGIKDAIGEPDKSYKNMGKKVTLVIPAHFKIIPINIGESEEPTNPYETTLVKGE